MHLPRSAAGQRGPVGAKHDVRIEHREQCREIASARGSEECVNDFALAGEIDFGGDGGAPHATAGTAGELPRRGR